MTIEDIQLTILVVICSIFAYVIIPRPKRRAKVRVKSKTSQNRNTEFKRQYKEYIKENYEYKEFFNGGHGYVKKEDK